MNRSLSKVKFLPRVFSVTTAPEGADIAAFQGLLSSLTIGLLFGGYFVLRYGGYWAEGDTVVFMRAITQLQEYATIFSPQRYDHGYAYSVWLATLSNLTGIPATAVTRWLAPLLGNVFLAVAGYSTFRAYLKSNRFGVVAASTLFLIPELVFTVSRGNHEKLTVTLTLLAALVLLKFSLRVLETPRLSPPWVVVYLCLIFSLVSLNSIFGSTFLVASSLAFVLVTFLFIIQPTLRKRFGKLWLPFGVLIALSWGVFFLIVGYVYPQPGKLYMIRDALEGLRNLYDEQEVVSNPYESYGTGGGGQWLNGPVAQLLSSFRWVLFIGSFVTWLYLLFTVFRNAQNISPQRLFVILLYGAYGLIMAVAFPIDFLGLSAGDNLSVRLYTYFSLFAALVLSLGVIKLATFSAQSVSQRTVTAAMTTLFLCFALLSLLKSTLDPLVSNRWIVYWPEEPRAIDFWSDKQDSSMMYGLARLRSAYVLSYGNDVEGANYIRNTRSFALGVPDETPYSHSLDSGLHRAEMTAEGLAWVPFSLQNRVYDNGRAQILHRVATTPFQK